MVFSTLDNLTFAEFAFKFSIQNEVQLFHLTSFYILLAKNQLQKAFEIILLEWETSLLIQLDKYKHLDVILLDRHHYTASAIKRRLQQPLWAFQEDSVMPGLSVLLSCHGTVYKRFIRSNEEPRTALGHHDAYLSCIKEHYGTPNHHVLDIDGKHGHLYAAGTIKSLILRELKR